MVLTYRVPEAMEAVPAGWYRLAALVLAGLAVVSIVTACRARAAWLRGTGAGLALIGTITAPLIYQSATTPTAEAASKHYRAVIAAQITALDQAGNLDLQTREMLYDLSPYGTAVIPLQRGGETVVCTLDRGEPDGLGRAKIVVSGC